MHAPIGQIRFASTRILPIIHGDFVRLFAVLVFLLTKDYLEGFLVLSTQFTFGPFYLLDWAFTNAAVLIDLLQAAIQDVGLGSLRIWSATLPDTIVSALAEQGFTPIACSTPDIDYRPSALGRALQPALLDEEWSLGEQDITDLGNWELRMGCSDEY